MIKLDAALWGFCFCLFFFYCFPINGVVLAGKCLFKGIWDRGVLLHVSQFWTQESVNQECLCNEISGLRWLEWTHRQVLPVQTTGHSAQNRRQRYRGMQSIWGWLHGSTSLRKTRQVERYQQRINFFCPCYNFDGHTAVNPISANQHEI